MATPAQIEANRKNAKKAGRPKGSKLPATIDRENALKAYRERGAKLAQGLLNKQLVLANGQTFLYKIEKYYERNEKGKKILRQKAPKLVTQQWEIESYLNGLVEDHEMTEWGDTFYFITTKEPDSKTIDSILDRTFGKPAQIVSGPDGGPVQMQVIVGMKVIKE